MLSVTFSSGPDGGVHLNVYDTEDSPDSGVPVELDHRQALQVAASVLYHAGVSGATFNDGQLREGKPS
jgi:hypothetical protein